MGSRMMGILRSSPVVVRLKGKIFGGFGLVGLLILISGISSYTLVGNIGAELGAFRQVVDRADAMRQLDLVIQKLQASVHLWQQSRDPAVAREIDAEITDAHAKLMESKSRAGSPEAAKTADDIQVGLAAYADGWHVMQQLAADRAKTYVEQIDARSDALHGTLARLGSSQLVGGDTAAATDLASALDAYMVGQLAVMRYRATGDSASVARAEDALAEAASLADKALRSIGDPKAQDALKQAKGDILAYRAAFDHVIQTSDAGDGRMVAWTKQGEALAASTAKLRQEAELQVDEVQEALVQKATGGSSSALMSVVAIFFLAMILSFVLTRSISQPIVRMTQAMKQLASGDKTVEIPDVTRRDEIGEMAQAVEIFKENAIRNERLETEAETSRNRETEAAEERRVDQESRSARLVELTQSFDHDVTGALKEVSQAAARLEHPARALATTAEETNRETAAVSSAAAQATGSVETVAAAAEELSVSIDEISRQVAESRRIAEDAVNSASRTNATVRGLAEAAQRIGAVVELINTIAGQTNLLALNATIEAARAGEMGKGFAVVASEVKALANQTAKATDEIAAQIAGMQQVTGEAVSGIGGISTIIEQINSIASNIAAAVDEQAVSTREIARSVQEAAAGTSGVSANIEAVNQAAGDTGSGAMAVLDAARALNKQSDLLRGRVDRFLSAIKVS
jgi:methyl-accepting chemotaxis protein